MTSKTQFTVGYFAVIGMFTFGLISNAKSECPQISHAVLGAQLVNFSSSANTPTYQPHLKGAVLPPGYGLMIRVEEKDMILRVAFSW